MAKSLLPSLRAGWALATLFILGLVGPAYAFTKQWTGGSTSGNWSAGANWNPPGPPVNGDELLFLTPVGDLLVTNDLVDLRVRSIAFDGPTGGFFLRGNPITVNQSGIIAMHAAGANTVALNVTNGAPQGVFVSVAGARLDFTGEINLNGFNIGFYITGQCGVSNVIRGAGIVAKDDPGTLTFGGSAANTYTGPTEVLDGRLELGKTGGALAIGAGSLQIGDGILISEVRLLAANQIGNTVPITIHRNGTLNLNGFNEGVGVLTFYGGTVTSPPGGIITPGNIFVGASDVSATISARLTLAGTRTWTVTNGAAEFDLFLSATMDGSGSLIKNGAGTLRLGGGLFTGGVTVNEGRVILFNNSSLGTTDAGTIVNANATLTLPDSVAIGLEPLTLGEGATLEVLDGIAGETSWAGNITLNNSSGSYIHDHSPYGLRHTGVISGTGNLIVRGDAGSGGAILAGSAANTYSGDTFVMDGFVILDKSAGFAIPGGTLHIDGSSGSDTFARILAPSQMPAIPIIITGVGLGGAQLELWDSATVGLLTLNGGQIITSGAATMLTLAGNVTATGPWNSISGRMSLGTAVRTFTIASHVMTIDASISGTGGIWKSGPGGLQLDQANTYSGLTSIAEGELRVSDPSALGSTSSATVQTNPGPSTLTIINTQGSLETLSLRSDLRSLGGSNSWAGNITLASDVTLAIDSTFLNLNGSISGPGDLSIDGTGTVIFGGTTANSYGDTIVNSGTLRLVKGVSNGAIPGNLQIGNGGTVQLDAGSQIADTSRINILNSGLFDVNGVSLERVASIEGSGQIDLGNGILETGDGASRTFSGTISGTGHVAKRGTGQWVLTGNNTYTGSTVVENGTLIVNGAQPQSPVIVQSTGTLRGNGTVGNITAAGAVAPGGSVGALTCSNLVFTSTGDLNIEMGGDVFATAHDQLIVRGTNNLANATLNVAVASGFAPTLNQNLDIIINDGSDAIGGTFAGLPANAVLTAGGQEFRISYAAGTGANDVRLTAVSNALRLVTVQSLGGGNRNGTFDPDECDTVNGFVITNVSDAPVTGISATIVPRTPGMAVTQPFSDFPDIPVGGRGTNLTPIQMSMLPSFQCGTNVRFDVVVHTAAHGTYRLPFNASLVDSGEEGALVRFDNNASAPIPDLGTLNSPINVTGIATSVRRVVVSLHITHTSLEDLDISLISPGGVVVELTSDNGGTASDYGTACADNQRTRFEAGAANLIANGSAPFVGVFAPEGALTAFNGDVGSDVNGVWTLRVVDDAGGAVGTLRCWSLFIAPAFCRPGGGPCESCPERTIYGFLNQGSPTAGRNLLTNPQPASCVTPKFCPPASLVSGPFHFDAYTFINGESNACVTVRLETEDCDLFSAAYRNSYNPVTLCVNYLGDIGPGTASGGTEYSFQVTAFERFVVVVNEVVPGVGCRYALTVSGGSCRPVLDIESLPNNRVAFDWSTATAIGFALERTNKLGSAPAWLPVGGTPIITDSHFRLTNTVSGSANFYRLRKP